MFYTVLMPCYSIVGPSPSAGREMHNTILSARRGKMRERDDIYEGLFRVLFHGCTMLARSVSKGQGAALLIQPRV